MSLTFSSRAATSVSSPPGVPPRPACRVHRNQSRPGPPDLEEGLAPLLQERVRDRDQVGHVVGVEGGAGAACAQLGAGDGGGEQAVGVGEALRGLGVDIPADVLDALCCG